MWVLSENGLKPCFYLIIINSPKYTKDPKSKETRIMLVLYATKFYFFEAQITFHSGYFFPGIISPSWQHLLLESNWKILREIVFSDALISDKYFEILKYWRHSKSLVINFLNFICMVSTWDNAILTDIYIYFFQSVSEYLMNETRGSSWKLQLILSAKSSGLVLRHHE